MIEREIFDQALGIADPEERSAFLDQQCGDDTETRHRVERMLGVQSELGGFLENPAVNGLNLDLLAGQITPQASAGTWTVPLLGGESLEFLGDYHIIREIGRGGMGIVYESEQQSLGRRVALKVLPKQALLDSKQKQRFIREAKAAANLHHTNIVPVFGVGEHEGMQYYAMQFIDGLSLEKVLTELKRMQPESDARANGSRETCDPDAVEKAVSQKSGEKKEQRAGANGEPPARHDISAFAVANSLITGQFEKKLLPDDSLNLDFESSPPAEAAGSTIGDHAFSLKESGTSGLSDTFALSGSVNLPGCSNDQKKSRSGKLTYYQSIARIGIQVADALQYAHDQGILHRDVKPSNLLLDTRGTVWVTDFGLAKHFPAAEDDGQAEAPAITGIGDVVGTLRYMPPEAFNGKSDPRSDLYSLGLTLYELLALKPAYDETDRRKLVKRVMTESPESLHIIDSSIPRDLVTIVHKAIDHDPSHRYQTAGELIDDLERYQRDEPIRARRISIPARFNRWCKRNPTVASLMSAIALLLLIVSIVSVVAADRFRRLADDRSSALSDAKQSRRELMQQLFQSGLDEARANRWGGRPGQRIDAMEAIRRSAELLDGLELGEEARRALRNEAIAALASVDLKPVSTWKVLKNTEVSADVSPDLTMFAADDRMGTPPAMTVHRLADPLSNMMRIPLDFAGHSSDCLFSPDGRYVAAYTSRKQQVRVAELPEARQILDVPATAIGFSSDGGLFAAGLPDGTVNTFELPSGKKVHEFETEQSPLEVLSFSPDRRYLALARTKGDIVEIREVETGRIAMSLHASQHSVDSLGWSSDGGFLAAGCWQEIDIWDLSRSANTPPLVLSGHESQVTDVQFVYAGRLLVSSSWDGTTRIWSSHSGEELMRLPGDFIRLDETGRRMVLRRGLELICYEIVEPEACHRFYQENIVDMALHKDGRLLALALKDDVCLWDSETHSELERIPLAGTYGLAFDSVSGHLITSGASGITEWPIEISSADSSIKIGPAKPLKLALTDPAQIRISRGNQTIVVDHGSEGNRQWRATVIHRSDSGLKTFSLNRPFLRHVAVSPDGNWVATGNKWGQDVNVWDASNGRHVARLTSLGSARAAFSPDNRWIVTNSGDAVRFWEVGNWSLQKTFPASTPEGSPIGFSADSRLAAVARNGQGLMLVDMESLEPVATLETNARRPAFGQILFTPDGDQLIASVGSAGIYVWDLRRIREWLAKTGLDWDLPALARHDSVVPPPERDTLDLGMFASDPDRDLQIVALIERLNEGYAILKSDRPSIDQAMDDLTLAIKRNPRDADSWILRGRLNWALGRDRQALDDFTEALARDPDNVPAFYYRGRTRWWMHDLTEAARDYEEVLRRDPDHSRSAFEGAMCYVQCPPLAKNASRALELIDKDVALRGTNAVDWHTQSIALYRLGRFDEAEHAVNQAISGGVNWLMPHLALAAIYHKQGKTELAREAYHIAERSERIIGISSQNGLQNHHWRREVAELLGISLPPNHKTKDGSIVFDGEHLLPASLPTEGRIDLRKKDETSQKYSLHWCPSHEGAELTFQLPEIPPGRYRVSARFTKSNMAGQVRWRIGDRDGDKQFDGYSPQTVSSEEVLFGEMEVRTGANELTVEVTGSHQQSSGYHIQIEELKLTPVTTDQNVKSPAPLDD